MIWRATAIALLMAGVAACATTASSEQTLFNGRDFTNWTGEVSGDGANGAAPRTLHQIWTVSDGELHCHGGSEWSWVNTTADYTNFRFQFEWRWDESPLAPAGTRGPVFNSGAFLRANARNPRPPNSAMPAMYEAQINPQSRTTGDIWITGYDHPNFHGERLIQRAPTAAGVAMASTTRAYSASQQTERPLGQWNDYDITFNGGRVVLRVNGQLVNEAEGAAAIPGKIGLECQRTSISFRNIRVTRLD